MTEDKVTVTDLSAFEGEPEKVGVGYKFEGFDGANVSISVGDVVVFEDPDAGHHVGECEFIHRDVFVGYVDAVYAVDYGHTDGYVLEVGTTAPLGRLEVGDRYTTVITEDGVYGGMNPANARDTASALVDSEEFDHYYRETWHLGRDGVPEDLWENYSDSNRTGPGCPVCRGDKGQDGAVWEGE